MYFGICESDEISKKELLGTIICTINIYGSAHTRKSLIEILSDLGFAAYIVFVYICVYLVYKCRRRIDAQNIEF